MSRRSRQLRAVGVVVLAVLVVALGVRLVQAARPDRAAPAPALPRPPAVPPGFELTRLPAAGPTPPAAVIRRPTTTATARSTGAGATPTATASGDALTAWARGHADALGMDWRALRAYAAGAAAARRADRSCRVGWSTLAGIGWVESRHGTLQGGEIDADGVVRPRVLGPALDGTGAFARVPDTDDGRLDGDTTWDRAVGPMQFTPATWRRYGSGNPSDIDAAAAAAGRLLCSRSDLDTVAAWRRSVLAYNASTEYLAEVWTAAEFYGTTAS